MSLSLPNHFVVPERLETADFLIRKICYRDAELDYAAVMSSIDIIHQTRGGTWPTTDLTFEDDQIDLAWHQREFESRSSFAYTVMRPDDQECLGCLYFYPPGFRGDASAGADVDISFWVTQGAYDRGLYPVLYRVLCDWVRDVWPFRKVVFSNVMIPT